VAIFVGRATVCDFSWSLKAQLKIALYH